MSGYWGYCGCDDTRAKLTRAFCLEMPYRDVKSGLWHLDTTRMITEVLSEAAMY